MTNPVCPECRSEYIRRVRREGIGERLAQRILCLSLLLPALWRAFQLFSARSEIREN